ncbi:MAG: 2-oxo acid dehydrogenase subunit E2, partial [Thermomicrobiales bacterium]|nr:2-oxo acid dehydrogenase subunit E2 [Thermomicrobiales bacterium]
MATVIMPKMGDGMEEGTLLRWLKSVGDEVDAGDPIAEIETDKVTLEIEAAEGGVLTQTLVGEGQTVPIGTAIATIGAEGEAPVEAAPAPAHAAAPAAAAENGAITAPAQAVQAPPAAGPAAVNGVSGPSEATAVTRGPGERLRASPLVKRLAEEHGLDLQNIAGTGPGGRIVKDDITPFLTGAKKPAAGSPQPSATPVAAAPAAQPAAAPATPSPITQAPSPSGRPAGVARDLSKIRRTTGKRMTESKQAIPHFYVTSEVDMDAAMAFREQVNSQSTDDVSKVSFNDLVVKAAALALREFPNLNASMEGDTLYDHANIDINMAVAIEGGLIAPFI